MTSQAQDLTILDLAADIRRATGLIPLTPRWEATVRALYGLPLREQDAELLAAITRRSKEQWLKDATAEGWRRPRRELWARVGRRGRKSFTMALLALYEACCGGHERYLAPGEQGLIAVISKDAAGSTIVARFFELHAQAIGISTSWSSIGSMRVLQLEGYPFSVAVFPCSARSPRGFAIACAITDEPAHWQTDATEYENADSEVLGALRPAMAQFPDAKLFAISSPLGRQGMHFENVDRYLDGADPTALAVEGPTWEWNPDITEARTRELERDERVHAREYRAVPQDGVSQAFSSALVEPMFRPPPKLREEITYTRPILAIDASGGSKCEFASALCAWGHPRPVGDPIDHTVPLVDDKRGLPCAELFELESPTVAKRDARGRAIPKPGVELLRQPLLYVTTMSGFAEWGARMGFDEIVEKLAAKMRAADAQVAVGDGYMGPSLSSEFRRHGLRFYGIDTTNQNKNNAVKRIRMLAAGRQLLVQEDALTRQQLLDYREHISGSGAITYSPKAGALADRVSVLVNLMIGEAEGHMSWSPAAPDRRRAGAPDEALG